MHFLIQLKRFKQNKVFIISYFILVLVISIMFIKELININIHGDSLYFLQESLRTSLIIFLYFLVISYEFNKRIVNSNLEEAVNHLPKSKLKNFLSHNGLLLVLNVFIFMVFIIFNMISASIAGVLKVDFIIMIMKAGILYVVLNGLLAIMMGSLLTRINKQLAYVTMVLIAIVISPLSEYLPYILYNAFDIDLYVFRRLFNIMPMDLDWVADSIYGIALETYKRYLIFMWLFFTLYVTLVKYSSKLRPVKLSLLALSLVCLVIFIQPQSYVIRDFDPKGAVVFDKEYYYETEQKNKQADFAVSKYEMNIDIDKDLSANLVMTIDNDKKTDKGYFFTLYRGFRVKSVTDDLANDLVYSQEGDYLYIEAGKLIDKIHITYKGHSPIFYSNKQGVLLPGVFPYYPMEGLHEIFDVGSSAFIPIISEDDKTFEVNINRKVESNLGQGRKLSGESQCLSLVSGFIENQSVGDYTVLNTYLTPSKIDSVLSIGQTYKNLLDNYDYQVKSLPKTIFLTTYPVHVNFESNGLISLRDHVFVYDLKEDILLQAFLKAEFSSTDNGLKEALSIYLSKDEITDRDREKNQLLDKMVVEAEAVGDYKMVRNIIERLNRSER